MTALNDEGFPDNRTVIVTGAASGIGLATATAFARHGASVALIDLDESGLHAAVETLGESAHAYPIDVTDTAAVGRALEDIAARTGSIHHVVNCAASFIARGADASHEQWMRSLDVNVAGSAMLTAAAARWMPRGGTVVNISSISAHAAQPNRWTYNATKAAILALTRGQAMDFAPAGIRVNTVSPGWIWTPEVERAAVGDRERWAAEWGAFHLLRRLGTADEVADAVLFLSGPRSSFITGTELLVDGGYSAMGPEGLGESARFAGTGDTAAASVEENR